MRDFFGNIIKTDLYGRKLPKKQIKREVIAENRRKGKAAEDSYKMRAQIAGYEVERTGRGHDFKLCKRDLITGKKKFCGYREIKSGNARKSELQNKTHKQMKGRYKVIKENPLFY